MKFASSTIAFALLLASLANAEYPAKLVWETSCGSGYDFCGHLEFCKSGSSTYGYRPFGASTTCGSTPGPLIRMSKGSVYKLTLHNGSSDPTLKTNMHTHGLHVVSHIDFTHALD